jgi:predicted Abi (CAAX) family protease
MRVFGLLVFVAGKFPRVQSDLLNRIFFSPYSDLRTVRKNQIGFHHWVILINNP